jgi:hypothetical protein
MSISRSAQVSLGALLYCFSPGPQCVSWSPNTRLDQPDQRTNKSRTLFTMIAIRVHEISRCHHQIIYVYKLSLRKLHFLPQFHRPIASFFWKFESNVCSLYIDSSSCKEICLLMLNMDALSHEATSDPLPAEQELPRQIIPYSKSPT